MTYDKRPPLPERQVPHYNKIESMKNLEKRPAPARASRRVRIPRAARFINTAIAAVLLGLSIYHYTQPNQAWRSGTVELASAALLLTAAYLFSGLKAMAVNLIIAVVVSGLGVRHLIHGGGWRSGITELFFAVLLVVAAVMTYRKRIK
jgi:threonine/homoserine/homoserine lactone efflux protein